MCHYNLNMALLLSDRKKPALNRFRDSWSSIQDDDTVYLITWNPKPKFYNYDLNGENDFDMQWLTMLDKLIQVNRCSYTYAFVAEISDMGKLHMHGFLVVSDKVKYHKSFLPTLRKNGFVKVSKASSNKWKTFKYHVKDLPSTCKHVTQWPIVLTPENCKFVQKNIAVYRALVSHAYDEKQIKKRNVMEMLTFMSGSDSE